MLEIQLDGTEITVLKAIGIGGGVMDGETFLDRVGNLEHAELLDTLKGLIMLGYVISDKISMNEIEDIMITNFHVNSGYTKAIREAMDPKNKKRKPKRSRRVRRE